VNEFVLYDHNYINY